MYKQRYRHLYKAVDLSGVPVYGVDVEFIHGTEWIIDRTGKYDRWVLVRKGSIQRIRRHERGL